MQTLCPQPTCGEAAFVRKGVKGQRRRIKAVDLQRGGGRKDGGPFLSGASAECVARPPIERERRAASARRAALQVSAFHLLPPLQV